MGTCIGVCGFISSLDEISKIFPFGFAYLPKVLGSNKQHEIQIHEIVLLGWSYHKIYFTYVCVRVCKDVYHDCSKTCRKGTIAYTAVMRILYM